MWQVRSGQEAQRVELEWTDPGPIDEPAWPPTSHFVFVQPWPERLSAGLGFFFLMMAVLLFCFKVGSFF